MLGRLPILFVLMSLVLGSCGNGLDEGDNLTEEQKLLVALEGTWAGTADGAGTMSGSQSVVFEMTLPADGEPRLEGLSGTIVLGGEIDDSQVNPENPNFYPSSWDSIRDGIVFDLKNIAIVSNRLLAEFEAMVQWTDFCEAQTVVYDNGGFYKCLPGGPGWSGECGFDKGPNGEEGCIFTGPNSEEVFLTIGKIDLCMEVCRCDSNGCTVEVESVQRGYNEMDIVVDIEAGVMLGTGSLGRIEAVKQ